VKRTIVLLSLVFFFVCNSFAIIGEWKTYTSKREVRDVAFFQGTIWAATSGGAFAFRLSDSSFFELTTSEGLRSNVLNAVAVDNDGYVYFGSNDGVIQRYAPATRQWRFDYSLRESQLANPSIHRFQILGDTLIIASEIGASLFSLSQFRFIDTYVNFGTGSNKISGTANEMLYANGKVLVATNNGIAIANANSINLISPSEWQTYKVAHGLPSNVVHSLSVFNSTIIAATDNGIAFFDGVAWFAIPSSSGISFHQFISFADTLLVLGTYSIYKIASLNTISTYSAFTSSEGISATTTAEHIIVGTKTNGILLSEGASWSSYFPDGPVSNHFLSVAVDNTGTIWSATNSAAIEGVQQFDGFSWKLFDYVPIAGAYRVNIGPQKSAWVSYWGGGLSVINANGSLRGNFNSTNGLPMTTNHQTSCQPFVPPEFSLPLGAVTDRYDTTWVAFRTPKVNIVGEKILVAFFNNNIVRTINLPDNNCHKFTDIALDNNGTIWFCNLNLTETVLAQDEGLFFFSPKMSIQGAGSNGWGIVTTSDGLLSNSITSVASDIYGDLWIGTEIGINIIFDASDPKRSIAFYTPLNGVKITAIVVDALNNKWIATPQGIYYLNSDGTSILHRYTVENTDGKLVSNEVLSLALDGKSGAIYFGTNYGLSSLRTAAVVPKNNFDKLTFSPNPFLIPSSSPMEIGGLIANSKIKIFSVDGTLVLDVVANSENNPGAGIARWDGKDKNGKLASTGIYFVIASDEQGKDVGAGKVAVVRK
jgi:ligand-binding sensor domain-containing protein